MPPTRQQILAASAGWVAVVLNVLPGLGAGYPYQRRWKAYWITSAVAQNQLVGLIGLLALAAVTAAASSPGTGTGPSEPR